VSGHVPDSKDEIRAALARAGLHPLKRFGQHFLADAAVLDRIVTASGAGPSSVVLEVGPGLGGLTARLLSAGAAVVAVEIDHGLARELRTSLVSPDFILLEQDVMGKKGRLADEVGAALLSCAERRGTRGFEVVANLPYGISSPFLLALAAEPGPPLRATVMLQTEVADALAAKPSSEEYSALSVSCQVFFAVTKAFKVGRQAFFPSPDVDSTVVTLLPRTGADVPEKFGEFVQKLFQGRRKALSTTLKPWLPAEIGGAREWLAGAGVDPGTRVEALSPAGILDLYRRVLEAGGGQLP
jgi:16S rRNA (adenine1518-N6/adenine1519-N6)-dimethyltransferase